VDEIFIGTDIVSVPRIEEILISDQGGRFKERVFSSREISYCDQKTNPAIHYAGRFAAKEAIKKSLLSSRLTTNIPMRAMEILPDDQGAPVVHLHLDNREEVCCRVSISHIDQTAIAFAILQKTP